MIRTVSAVTTDPMSWWPRLIKRLAEWFDPEPRVIFDRVAEGPYLTRYYIDGRPVMPGGGSPWNELGDVHRGAVWPKGLGKLLHCFHRSDNAKDLHSHPWRWAVSLILSGGYEEERWDPIWGLVRRRRFRPGMINVLRLDDYHRVDLIGGQECWSLFITGPRYTSWGFRVRETGEVVHHTAYVQRLRKNENGLSRPATTSEENDSR